MIGKKRFPIIFLIIWIILFSLHGMVIAMADEQNKQIDSDALLNKAQGQILLQIARRTIADRLGVKMPADKPDALKTAKTDRALQDHRGTFVTLTIDGNLRGCIGSLTPLESIVEGVQRNAINAAFKDPRFNLLTREEFENVAIEVSILSEPKPLQYKDGDDLVSKLRVNIDGVIIRKGSASATFLPQVWAQLPQPEFFLEHLCRKSGLSNDAWRSGQLEVFTYQVQYFEEHP